jgi:predicted RNase H-like HicB family nuclease
MKYAVLVQHDEGSAYGVSVPDLPGFLSAGDTFDEALENVIEAIEFHLEGLAEEGTDIPSAEPIDAHLDNPDYAYGAWVFVDIDFTPYLGKIEKINVTLANAVIREIDAKHKNRSRFLASGMRPGSAC